MKVKVWFPFIKGASGTDVFTRRQADALQRRGIRAEVTCFPAYYEFAPFLLRSVPAPPGTDIIHANSWNGFAFKRPGIPLVVTEHHCVFDPRYRPYKSFAQHIYHKTLIRPFEMASFQEASTITAVSRFTASSLAQTLNITSAKVIHNWIDTTTFTPLESIGLSRGRPFRLLFVGNPSMRKGVDLLASIMNELGPNFELRVTSGLRGLKDTYLTPNMIPLGWLEDTELIEAYKRCDALLFPSRFEGFGYAPLEAMACGKPVISTDISSLPEVIEDGVTGILCPVDDVGAFVTACRNLANNPTVVQNYGHAARQRAEAIFSEEIIVPQYVALYERLASGTDQ